MTATEKELELLASRKTFYKGLVENVNDPLLMGRIQVRILGVHAENKDQVSTKSLPWAQVVKSTDFGGLSSGIGLSSGPSVGVWVWVFFDLGQYDKPVVIGAISGADKGLKSLDPGYKSKHTIKTPLNHIIQIDDANAEMRLHHANGCEVLLNSKGIVINSIDNTDVLSTNTITIKGKDINIESSGSIKLTAGGSITLKSSSNTMVI